MADIALGRFKKKGYFVFLIIKGGVFPFNGLDLLDAFFLEGFAAVVAVQDDGGFLAILVVEYPLYLDWGKLGIDVKGFSVCVYGLLTFGGSGVDGFVPG